MATWKKVLTDGDNTNIGTTDLTTTATRSLTTGSNHTFSIDSNSGTSFIECIDSGGTAFTINFNALIYNVNSIISTRGITAASQGQISLFEAANDGSNYISLTGPNISGGISQSTAYNLPDRPTSDNSLLVSGTAASISQLIWANELNWDNTNKELDLNGALVKPLAVSADRSGTLLDSTEIDAGNQAIGEFIHLSGLASSTFANERVFNITSGASLANADTEGLCTNMLVWNNIAQTSSTTLTALRKGVASVQSSLVEGTFGAGKILYLDNGVTDGLLTFDRPTTSGHFVRHVGYALREEDFGGTDHIIFVFDPSPDFIKLG